MEELQRTTAQCLDCGQEFVQKHTFQTVCITCWDKRQEDNDKRKIDALESIAGSLAVIVDSLKYLPTRWR